MTWKPPRSEDEWAELLSAHADGALTQDEAAPLAAYLATDAARQAQLESLRDLSRMLQTWGAPDVAVPPSLRAGNRRRSNPIQWWQIAAGFAAGLATAFGAVTAVQDAPAVRVVHVMSQPATPQPVLSAVQAEDLIREAAADALRGQIEQLIANRQLSQAEERLTALQQQYAGTQAAANPALNILIEQARERTRWRERRT